MAQCSSCQFFNMPGASHCGRCGTSLTLATATIDIHPPRASSLAKAWRRLHLRRLWSGLRAKAVLLLGELRTGANPDVASMALFRLLVPGWFQIHAGRRTVGYVYLTAAIVSVLMTLLTFGSGAGAMWLGLVWAVHAGSLYDAIRMNSQDFTENITWLLGYGLVISCIVYFPLYAFGSRYTIPMSFAQALGPFQQGDVVVYGQYSSHGPRAGDVVVYRIREITIRQPGRNIAVRGLRVDRILAGPGQTVRTERQRLLVDGVPTQLAPLAGMPPGDMTTTHVPADHVFIISSAEFGQFGVALDPQLTFVPINQILGQVYWRHLPWSRMGFVQ